MPVSGKLSGTKRPRPLYHKVILGVLGLLVILATGVAVALFRTILVPNVIMEGREQASLYIPTGAGFEEVCASLAGQGILRKQASFEWVAKRKNYPALVRPGHYVIRNGMNNNELVNLLRSGRQTPIRVTFNNIRLKTDLAGKISRQIEADSVSLLTCWADRKFLEALGTTPEQVATIFIPNTYELWWNTDAYEFTERMHREFTVFWSNARMDKLKGTGLTREEAIILASIVEKETQKDDEKPLIAGVYLNRLRKGWPLQADPTLVFASGEFDLKRVLNRHKEIDSPYNTYKHTGLPPGPICLPSISSIDAVLDYRKHDYMFFCARSDLSGYHAFSRTLHEHNRHARAYQQALNNLRI